jgi:hypothetical protein
MTTHRKIRIWLVLFLIGLVLSGATAFPLEHEVRWLHSLLDGSPAPQALIDWIALVDKGITETNDKYPFIMYGTDWLAFAHLVIAVAFWGPLRDPVRNIWVIEFGMIACAGIVPLALFAGPVRGIPGWWTVLDISFGVFGIIPLLVVHRLIKRLSSEEADNQVAPKKPLQPIKAGG